MSKLRRYNRAGTARKAGRNIEVTNKANELLKRLRVGQRVTIVQKENLTETVIEQKNSSCIFVQIKGQMVCINTADIITKRYEVWEV